MKEEFDVQMSKKLLYNYMLYHAYRGLSGILGTFMGIVCIVAFLQNYQPAYLAFGVLLILYIPVTLHLQAARQFAANEALHKPLHYCLGEEGMTVSQGETETTIAWDDIVKAVSTPDSILVYTGAKNASVFPKKQLGDQLVPVVQILSRKLPAKKVKIRGNM